MEFTASELLEKSMSVMGETSRYKSGYEPFLVNLINQIIADCFDTNNAVRTSKGYEPILSIPWISSQNDVITYEPEIVINVMNYGLAFWLLFQDDENDKANVCHDYYESNKARAAKAQYTNTEDFYR